MRSVEENWTSGTRHRLRDHAHQGQDIRRHGAAIPGNTTQTLIRSTTKSASSCSPTRTTPTRRTSRGVDGHGRAGRRQSGGGEARDRHVGPGVGAVRGTLPRARRRFARGVLNQKLVIISPNAPNLDDPITLEHLGGGRFRLSAEGGGAVRSGAFHRAGRPPMRMYIGDGWIDRVSSCRFAASVRSPGLVVYKKSHHDVREDAVNASVSPSAACAPRVVALVVVLSLALGIGANSAIFHCQQLLVTCAPVERL